MFVNDHAIERIGRRLAVRGGGKVLTMAIVARLEAMTGTADNVAIEVHRFLEPVRDAETGSNGDQLIVIARSGTVETIMLRRSWNQPFTRSALGVDRVVRLPA